MDVDGWLKKLGGQLTAQAAEAAGFEAYYEGRHPLPAASDKAHEAYRRLMRLCRSNWMALVVDAVTERLRVDGFRRGDSKDADADAWRIWQANHLDADSGLVHDAAVTTGRAYVVVWANAEDERTPLNTVEHPCEMTVAYAAGLRRRRLAAFKRWLDDDSGFWMATLYLPDGIYKFRGHAKANAAGPPVSAAGWVERHVEGEDWPLANPLGVVPVVEFQNNPRMMGGGRSELDGVTDIQDRINETLFNRLMAADISAFRQRWITGMEIPVDPATNQPVEPFKAAIDRVWHTEDPKVKFGEFSEATLTNYIASVESDIQHLAAITRTPPHYLLGQSGAFPSGDSLKATETGLVAKVRKDQLGFGESWEEVDHLNLLVLGDPRANDPTSEVIWHDPESRSQGELVDALVKMSTLGVPNEVLWQRWGASPQEITRWQTMQAATQLRSMILPPPTTTISPARPPTLPAA